MTLLKFKKDKKVDYQEIGKSLYQNAIDDLAAEHRVVLTPEFVFASETYNRKPEAIENKYFEGRVKSSKFYFRTDSWIFPENVDEFKKTTTLVIGIKDVKNFTNILTILTELPIV